jgi:hypothetical protein
MRTFATLIGRADGAAGKCSFWVNEDNMQIAKERHSEVGLITMAAIIQHPNSNHAYDFINIQLCPVVDVASNPVEGKMRTLRQTTHNLWRASRHAIANLQCCPSALRLV